MTNRIGWTLGAVLLAAASAGAQAVSADEMPLPPSRPVAEEVPATTPTFPAVPTPLPNGRLRYLPLIEREAKARGLPAEVADAVARVESGYDPGAVGGAGERGLMQVMPPTASMLGFKGSLVDLAEPETNIKLGVQYLAGAWRLANGDLCRALMKYRAGHNEERMSALSVEYCRRAKSHLAALGSPLGAGALPAITLGGPLDLAAGAGPTRIRRIAGRLVRVGGRRLSGGRFWAAHTARIRAIEARLPWKRGGILARG